MTTQRLLLALGPFLLSPFVAAQDVADVAGHAPAESCFAAASANVADTCAAFQETRLGETLCGPAFEPLIAELRRRGLAGPLNLRPAVGFDWSDLAEVRDAGGLFIFPLADDQLGVAWIFRGTSNTASGGLLATAARHFSDKRFGRSSVRRGAAELTVYTPPRDDKDQSPRVLFAAPGYYGVANSQPAAEAIVDVQPDGSLASDAVWQRARTASDVPQGPGDATLMMRPLALWELLRKNREAQQPADEQPADAATDEQEERDPLASAQHLGFARAEAVAGRLRFAPDDEHDWTIEAALQVPRPYEKALRLLELKQGPLPEVPDWIAADVTSASFWRWDFPLAMQGYGNLFDEANEPGPDGVGLFDDMLDGLRDDPEGVQVDLRRDIFEQIGPAVLNVTDRHGPETDEMPHGERTLYVAQVRDMPRVIDALKRFYRGDDLVTHRRSGNYDVWTVPEGSSLFIEGESDSVVFVRALAVGEDRMLFGTDVNLLNSALAGDPPGPSLKDAPDFARLWRAIQQRHAEGCALCVVARLNRVLEPAYQRAARQEREEGDPLATVLWRVLLFGTNDEDADLPYAAVPPYGELDAALPPAGIVMSPALGGFSITIDASRGENSQ